MKKTTCLVDESGIELLVTYDLEFDRSFYAENGNPGTYVQATYEINIECVELVIASKGIDITRQLDNKQIDHIINELNITEWLSLA